MKLLLLFTFSWCAVVISAYKPSPRACPENEIFYECGPNCQSECETLGEPCLINYFRCPDGCYCIDNYARVSPQGKCVPKKECPPKKKQ